MYVSLVNNCMKNRYINLYTSLLIDRCYIF